MDDITAIVPATELVERLKILNPGTRIKEFHSSIIESSMDPKRMTIPDGFTYDVGNGILYSTTRKSEIYDGYIMVNQSGECWD